ncbi:MAG TPA: hypothetical protein VFG47_12795 [Geminicoccaceae bacterium]|nr:hypothetical protein [Geminicoccaceae bacterium]
MGATSRPIAFLDFLPAVFRRQGEGDGPLRRFLAAFEALFEELEDAIEGAPDGVLRLRVVSTADATVTVGPFRPGPVPRPAGTTVIAADGRRTTLAAEIPAGDETSPPVTRIELADAALAASLTAGDGLTVHAGGLPDLFHFRTTPPPQLRHSPATEFAHLAALAAWLDLPLRPEKPVDWNRRWFAEAVRLHPRRATLPGLDALLRAWLEGDLLAVDRQIDGPPLILTDLTRRGDGVAAALQLGVTATLGVDTVLGEGPPHVFIVDLPTAPELAELRRPDGLEVLHRAARALLDREKPAWTLYELRIRVHGLELAPDGGVPDGGFDHPYAQLGRTTLLWDRPWVFEGRE